jgi:hypothetical protein
MKIKYIKPVLAAAVSALALLISGCVSTPDGHSQVGIPWVYKDHLTSRYPRTVKQVSDATTIVLSRNGKLLLNNAVDNTFKAKINEQTVYVKVTKVDDKITELEIMARTALGADIELASEMDKQIALQLVNS